MKKKTKIIIISVIAFLILLGSIIFSFNKFSTFNSLSSFIGVIKIMFTNAEYDVIQNIPYKVIIAKPNTESKTANELLDEYMNSRGYFKSDRFGSEIIYSNGTDYEGVHFSVNAYYSVWEWR